jgi:hypothetical protein
MAIKEDTDPSTPSALALATTDPTPTDAKVSTDPGIGPAGSRQGVVTQRMPARRTPPMGMVVPASAPAKHKDSIELLLDGMQGAQPERPKTMPQTDGQASAAYHAEHLVRPARTSPDEEPKVVVERPVLSPTTRIDRARVQAAIEQAEAQRREQDTTASVPQEIAPRVLVAVVAGLVVVLGLFVVLRLATGQRATKHDSASSPGTTAAPTPLSAAAAPMAPPPATANAPAAAAAPVEPPAQEATASPVPPGPTPTAAPPRAAPRKAPANAGTNLGEFKPSYH